MFRLGISYLRRRLPVNRSYFSTKQNQMKVLPFKISRKEADEILISKQKFLEKTSNSVLKNNELIVYEKDPIQDTFIPFHTVDVRGMSCYYSGEYGKDRLEPYTYYTYENGKSVRRTGVKVVTDWHDVSGTLAKKDYPLGTRELQVYAGFKYPGKYVENSLATEHITDITSLTDDMLINENKQRRVVEAHEMTTAYGLKKITTRLYDIERIRTENHIINTYGADHVNLTVFEMYSHLAKIKQYSYHSPAYVYEYTESGRKLYKIINGHTGNFDGQTVYSFWKSLFLGASIGSLITPIMFIGNPALTASFLLTRILFGAAAAGLPAGTLAKLYPFFKYKHEAHKLEKEKENNQQTQETLEDELRRKLAYELNMSVEQEIINNLPVDKCKLLSIDPKNKVTLQSLKDAYYREVKKFHPDVYDGDKEVGENMTKNINEAYKTLEKIVG